MKGDITLPHPHPGSSPPTASIIWHNQQVLQLCLQIDPESFYFSFLLDPTLVQPCYLLGLCSSFCLPNPHSFPLQEAQGCLRQVSSLLCSRALHGSHVPQSKTACLLSAHKTLPVLLGHLPALTFSHSPTLTWPQFFFWKTLGVMWPQGLCTGCCLCLEHSYPESQITSGSSLSPLPPCPNIP